MTALAYGGAAGVDWLIVSLMISFLSSLGAGLLDWRLRAWIEKFDATALLRVGWLTSNSVAKSDGETVIALNRARHHQQQLLNFGPPVQRRSFANVWWSAQAMRICIVIATLGWLGCIVWMWILYPEMWPFVAAFFAFSVCHLVWGRFRAVPWLDHLSQDDNRTSKRWDR